MINMRPIVSSKDTRSLPFFRPNCGLKGASDRHNWLPRAIQYCGTPAPDVPFCIAELIINYQLATHMQNLEKFLTKRNVGIVVGTIVVSIALKIVIGGFEYSPGPVPTQASAPSAPSIDFEKMERSVNGLIQTGLIQKVDIEMNDVYVDGLNWATLNVQDKENVSRAIAYYIGYKKNKNLYYVNVIDWNSGVRLARYSDSWGFKIGE